MLKIIPTVMPMGGRERNVLNIILIAFSVPCLFVIFFRGLASAQPCQILHNQHYLPGAEAGAGSETSTFCGSSIRLGSSAIRERNIDAQLGYERLSELKHT